MRIRPYAHAHARDTRIALAGRNLARVLAHALCEAARGGFHGVLRLVAGLVKGSLRRGIVAHRARSAPAPQSGRTAAGQPTFEPCPPAFVGIHHEQKALARTNAARLDTQRNKEGRCVSGQVLNARGADGREWRPVESAVVRGGCHGGCERGRADAAGLLTKSFVDWQGPVRVLGTPTPQLQS